jgi:TPR repeat protein
MWLMHIFKGASQTAIVVRISLLALLGSSVSLAQVPSPDIPEGVKIKVASDADNALAKTVLQEALVSETSYPKALLGGAATCGPTLWAALKGSADSTLLQSKVVTTTLSLPEPLLTVSRVLVTDEQREAFWKLLRARYPALKSATVRKPSADEIRYYWATIPFDIEEPLFSVQAGQQTFIVNLRMVKNRPVLFWFDLVDDLRHLRDQDLTADEVAEVSAVADAGMPISTYEVGRAYLLGRGVPVDVEKGRVWLDRAAQKDSLDAQMMLGASYLSGTRLPKDPRLASKYLLQAAQQQHVVGDLRSSQALAQYWIALMYEQGNGLDKSHEKAIQFLKMSADNGNSSALYDLASLYNDGSGGMSKDVPHACELFEKAANRGNVKAMHNVGYCYQVGSGGKKDDGKAIEYYTKAAEGGSVRSQGNLGILFGQLGQAEKSYFWLRVAEASGDTEKRSLIDVVKGHLTPSQVEQQDRDVLAWLKSHQAKTQ